MSDFEFLFAFFSLLVGLIVAELATKFADAIEAARDRPIGLLTPLLTLFVLLDITSFWLFAWSMQTELRISWRTVFSAMTIAIVYFLAASMIFPRNPARWANLDEHYWDRKRLVLAGVVSVNLIVVAQSVARLLPSWSDGWFFFYQLTYFVPAGILMLSRSRSLDLAMFAILIGSLIISGFDLLPSSQWARDINLAPS